jgi:hypothetical protein
MSVILATQRSGGLRLKGSPANKFVRLYLKKPHHKKGLVECLKVLALSLSSSTTKKKKKGK